MKRSTRLAMLLTPALALALSGCTGGSAVGTSNTATEATALPTRPAPQDLSPRDHLSAEAPVGFERFEATGSATVRVHFVLEKPDCSGARAVVKETSSVVRIAVVRGLLPGAPSACAANAQLATMSVTLKEPLGKRRLEELPADEIHLR